MNALETRDFVKQYLVTQDCHIIDDHEAYITAQLSPQVDQDIIGRHYYWMFVQRTGAEPQPMTVTFIFDQEKAPSDMKGELLVFGCWRLHQIFESVKKYGKFIRLYDEIPTTSSKQGLIPWLYINFKISMVSDQKKDYYYPLGINLITGDIRESFDEVLSNFTLTPRLPDYHYTMAPIYSVTSASQHLENKIKQFIESQDKAWAEEAHQRLDQERHLIASFFESLPDDNEEILTRRVEEVEAYRPCIKVVPINMGLVHLRSQFTTTS